MSGDTAAEVDSVSSPVARAMCQLSEFDHTSGLAVVASHWAAEVDSVSSRDHSMLGMRSWPPQLSVEVDSISHR